MLTAVLLLSAAAAASAKIVATLVDGPEPDIASQFCFQTVVDIQGKGTITIEAISTEKDQRIAVFPVMASAEIKAMMADDPCEVSFTLECSS